MNTHRPRRYLCILIGSVIAFPIAALAQETRRAATGSVAATVDEPSIVLSPFVVDATRDTGYQAASTLAGTRLNTPLKDIGAAISVYTKDLLNDIGATKISDVLIYATGMEAAGIDGNYSGTFGENFSDSSAVRNRPQFTTRSRGLAGPGTSRSYFNTAIPLDGYNTERVTVNRGPNAMLFGVGSPSGIVDNALILPTLNRDHHSVEYRLGSDNSHRASVDFNRRLIDRKLGVRLAALSDQRNFTQRPAYERDQRIHTAVAYEPFKFTALRATLEHGRIHANRPNPVLPLDNITTWLDAGKPIHDFRIYDQDPARNAQNFEPAVSREPNLFGNIAMFYTSPDSRTPDQTMRVGIPVNLITRTHPLVNRDGAADNLRFLGTRNLFTLPDIPVGTRYQGFSNPGVFDFSNRQFEGSTGFQREHFRALNVALEQRAWHNRVGVELVGDFQRYIHDNFNPFGNRQGNEVFVDINALLPNGQANPNVGRPYVVGGQEAFGHIVSTNEGLRATAFIRYDFAELKSRFGHWLGRHTLTGLAERNQTDFLNFGTRLVVTGAAPDSLDTNLTAFSHRDTRVVYVGPSLLNATSLADVRLDQINARGYDYGATYTTTYWDTAAQDFTTAPTTISEINNGANISRDVLRSRAAILQSYWLRDHLTTIVGWRRDHDYYFRLPIPYDARNPEKAYHGLGDFVLPASPPPQAGREITSYSIVGRWPQKIFQLPFGAELGAFFNVSENFTPLAGRVNAFGKSLPSTSGETKEYGLNLSFLQDRITFRIARFDTALVGQTLPAATNLQNRLATNAILQTAQIWVADAAQGVNRQAEIDLLFSPLPADFKDLYQYRVTTDAQGRPSASYIAIASRADTSDARATGSEFEILANPTPRWRVMANVTKQLTVTANAAPNSGGLIALMRPVLDRLRNVPRSSDSFGQYIDTQVILPYETLKAQEGTANPEQRKWRVNLITNYSFGREGNLKGWGVGGGLRWQDRVGIGYPVIVAADGTRSVDVKRPYYASELLNGDAWISHTRKLWRDRVGWKIQLNVRNIIRSDDLIPVVAQPTGQIAQYRVAPPMTWTLAQTFTF